MYNICIVGATGLVGRVMINEVHAFEQEVKLTLFASKNSAGKIIDGLEVQELNHEVDFSSFDIAIFSAGKNISLEYGPLFANAGCYVVDNSSAFRKDKDIPLLSMGVNLEELNNYDSKIIANPNCSTIQSVIVLNELNRAYNIKSIDYTTYLSVSGSGVMGVEDLKRTQEGLDPINYDFPIANNVIPQIDTLLDDGYTFEEEKMMLETQKILNHQCDVSATCVRIPVDSGHTVQMKVVLDKLTDITSVFELLDKQEHLKVLKDSLPMPLYVKQKRHVDVGRIRIDRNSSNVVHLMCVADNLYVGAATNACEIAKYLIREVL